MPDQDETKPVAAAFDFDAYPEDTLFYERRGPNERRYPRKVTPVAGGEPAQGAPAERRVKKERRRRIDPTTFEKQYTDDEIEFMNAMQQFKVQSGKSFPSHGEVLQVAFELGYRQLVPVGNPQAAEDVGMIEAGSTSPLEIPPETSAAAE